MFSKSCQYAIRAVLCLAAWHHKGEIVGVKQIAEELNVPQQFLAKILQQLVRQNLLSSVKGPGGGFYLSEDNLQIPLLQIIECIDGVVLNACVLGLPACSSENPCQLHHQFFACREGFKETLASSRISDFAHKFALQ